MITDCYIAVNTLVKNKSTNWEKITPNFKNRVMSSQEVASVIKQGYPIVCAKMVEKENGRCHREDNSFIEANCFGIDIDNAEKVLDERGNLVKDSNGEIVKQKIQNGYTSIENLLENPLVKNNALLVYETPSSTLDWQRLRVLFKMEKSVTSKEELKEIVSAFILELGGDSACKDSCRLFYGNTNCDPIILDNNLKEEVLQEIVGKYRKEKELVLSTFKKVNLSKPVYQWDNKPYKELGILTPFDDYDTRTDTVDLLLSHGWTIAYIKDGVYYLTRPGKSVKDGVSATFNYCGGNYPSNHLYVFTSSTEFQENKSYLPYAVYTILEHGGDFKEARKALYKEGYGERMEQIVEKQAGSLKEEGFKVYLKCEATPQFLAEEFLKTQKPLYFIREEFYQFNGVSYKVQEKDAVKSKIQAFIMGIRIADKKSVIPYQATSKNINDLYLNISLLQCRQFQNNEVIGDSLKELDGSKLIILKNGILDLTTRKLYPHTPDYFSTIDLKMEYDPKAECPKFREFIEKQVDLKSQNLIQEWFGYNLLKTNPFQKYMVFYGLPRSGKSTAIEILQELVGIGNYSAFTFAGMASDFGLSHYVNKQAIFSGDAHLSSLSSEKYTAVLERLKGITGNDLIEINRKGKSFISIHLPLKITFAVNEIPRFNDKANALMRRLLVVKFPSAVSEQEQNNNLREELKLELSGILNYALDGLDNLEGSKLFSFIDEETKEEFKNYNNPLQSFITQECEVSKGLSILAKDLYEKWKVYCEEDGYKAGGKNSFGSSLASLGITIRRGSIGNRPYFYEGIDLKQK